MRNAGMMAGVLFLLFGILILILPQILNWLVGIFFIIAGILALTNRRW